MNKNSSSNLIDHAIKASEKSYSPFSRLKVGAAIKCMDGSIFTGTNVENISYSLSICAERVAVFKAIAEGKNQIQEVALFADWPDIIVPCGACLQVLAEFSKETDLIITCGNKEGQIKKRLSEIFPSPFKF